MSAIKCRVCNVFSNKVIRSTTTPIYARPAYKVILNDDDIKILLDNNVTVFEILDDGRKVLLTKKNFMDDEHPVQKIINGSNRSNFIPKKIDDAGDNKLLPDNNAKKNEDEGKKKHFNKDDD